MKGCQMQLEKYIPAKQTHLYVGDGKQRAVAQKLLKKSCLELFPLDHHLLWLPRVALQASQISLFCLVLNTPKEVLLDFGNSVTCNSSAPQKAFGKTSNFICFLNFHFACCNCSLVCGTFPKPHGPFHGHKRGVRAHGVTAGAVRARYLISARSLKVVVCPHGPSLAWLNRL